MRVIQYNIVCNKCNTNITHSTLTYLVNCACGETTLEGSFTNFRTRGNCKVEELTEDTDFLKKRFLLDAGFISKDLAGVKLFEVPNKALIDFIIDPPSAIDFEEIMYLLYTEAVNELIYRRIKKITIE